jgi:hypothetical protein
VMPDDTGQPPPVNENNVLNVVLADDNKVYWWKGLDPDAQQTNYSKDGIRKLLLEKNHDKLIVLIKPMDNSKYENMIDILDEIAITQVKTYAIVDFTEDDKTRIP